jgi:thioredoxin 1
MADCSQGKKGALLIGAVSLALCVNTLGGIAATPTTGLQAQITQAKLEIAKGNAAHALVILTQAKKQAKSTADNCLLRLLLGRAYASKAKSEVQSNPKLSNEDYIAAKLELRAAIRLGHGNAVASQANKFMVSDLPASVLMPKNGDGTEMIAARLGLRGMERGSGEASKPKIYEFSADWCEPCKLLKPVMDKIKYQYGDQIEVTVINVDDANNNEIVEQYDVSPVPTVIYMTPDSKVVGYSVGYSGEKNVQKELQKILPTPPTKG